MDEWIRPWIAQHVCALREGDDAAKTAGALGLGNLVRNNARSRALIAEAGGIPLLVELLRDGSAKAKKEAAWALGNLACNAANRIAIAEAGGIPPLVELLRAGSAKAKEEAAWALGNLAPNAANKILIAEAGGVPALVELLRDESADIRVEAARALRILALNNDAKAAAIAVAFGFEALVELTRRGSVTVLGRPCVQFAGIPAKRKAALVVAALLGDCVPDSVPRVLKAEIGSYL